jgi:hypothetical protein
MVYVGTYNTEYIHIREVGNPEEEHFISLEKSAHAPTFKVGCCCDQEWEYEFWMENNSDYERIKMTIMDAAFECDSMSELLNALSDMFMDGFEELLVAEKLTAAKDSNKYLQ